jgi:thioesterase domain-containing protein
MRHLVEILGLHLKETFRYAPPPWPGRAVLFQSDWTRRRRGRRRPGADRSLGWSRLLLRGVEVLAVPGDHLALLRRPCVEELARQMTRVLGEA